MRMIKNSVGVWAFVPPGYHHQVAQEPMVEKRRKVTKEARAGRGEA
jgi:hypothetical protein